LKARPKPATTGSGCLGLFEGRTGTILVFFVILPLMLCLLLVLPPIALPSRIVAAGYVAVAQTGVEVHDPDGTSLLIPQGAVTGGSSIKLSSTPLPSFLSSSLAQSLPNYLDAKSPLYTFDVQGERPNQATLSVPIPNNAEPYATLDLYAYYANQWFKIPFILNEQDLRLESDLNFVPDNVVVAQTKPQAPLIGAMLNTRNSPSGEASKVLVEVNPGGLRLTDQGAVAGDVIALPATSAYSTYQIVPTVTNVDENGARLDYTENMLGDDAQRSAHIRTLVDLAVQKLYAGYNISYEGLGTQDADLFTAFIKELAKQLHAQQKILSVTLPLPKPVSEDQWDTAGYDWALIGRYADEVKIPMLPNPRDYEGDTPLIDQYLQWAAGQIDRYKLQVTFSSLGRDQVGNDFNPIPYNNVLKLLGPVTLPSQLHPGDKVMLELSQLRAAGGIQRHEASGLFYFNYSDEQGAAHTVWLENADSLAKKVALLLKYNLHGVALQDVESNPTDPQVWAVLNAYRSDQAVQAQSNLSIVWLVDGQPAGTSSASDPRFAWTVPSAGGQHTIDVALSADDGTSFTPSGQLLTFNVQEPTPVPPTPVPTEVPTKAPTASKPRPTAQSNTRPTNPNPAPAPARIAGNHFGYGAQLNWTGSPLGNDGEMSTLQGMGFGWAKIQVRWCDIQGSSGAPDLSSLDNMNNLAKAHGIKLLFSVICGPTWAGGRSVDGNPGPPDDPNLLGQFMGTLAEHYCPASGGALGAIEVWNETNLSREWGPRPLNGADYVKYLQAAYTAIKQKCPSIVVVSGAPTPTGYSGPTATPDNIYLQQMYSAGLKQYSDAIGIHPSGYNVPVDCDIRTCPMPSGISFTAPWEGGGARHYSWSFLSMMNTYRSIMVANGDSGKQLWATEFGWGVSGSPAPGYEYEKDNSPDEQAQWLVKAYQYAKSWGWAGVMFTWNLDFNNSNADNRAFAILGAPAQAALTNMPK
jgi:Glycosyl hydrolases family 18